jgi:hypothetical protein
MEKVLSAGKIFLAQKILEDKVTHTVVRRKFFRIRKIF